MIRDKNAFLEWVLKSYEKYFDIEMNVCQEGIPFAARAVFHSRSEKYVLVKSAKLWAAETNDYTYFITDSMPFAESFRAVRDRILDIGLREIHPHNEHMYSYVTLIYIAENIGEDIKQEIKAFNYHKIYRLSFHGWMYFRMAAVDLSKSEIISNKKGRELKELLKKGLRVIE